MKRNGYVANSSSSSFLIYGIEIPESEDGEDWCKRLTAHDARFKFYSPEYCNTYIGISWGSIGDEETGADLKATVRRAVEQEMGPEKAAKCQTLTYAWYNG